MGLPNWLHWTAWFLKCFVFLLISVILMVVLLKVKWYSNTNYTVFTHSNPLVLLMFLILYICATITFCFALSVFFSKGKKYIFLATVIEVEKNLKYDVIQKPIHMYLFSIFQITFGRYIIRIWKLSSYLTPDCYCFTRNHTLQSVLTINTTVLPISLLLGFEVV